MIKERDWKRFVQSVAMIDQVTAGKPRTKEAFSTMFKLLEDYTFEDISRALEGHARTNKFLVQPADIISIIEGDIADKSLVAWRVFLKSMEHHGFYSSVRFPDPAYHYAIDLLGGWMRLCEEWHGMTDKEIEFRGKDWRKLYEIGVRKASWDGRDGTVKVPPYFKGFHEWNNRSGGFLEFVPKVVQIGTGEMIPQEMLGAGDQVRMLTEGNDDDGQRKIKKIGIRTEDQEGIAGRSGEGLVSVSQVQFQEGVEREEN